MHVVPVAQGAAAVGAAGWSWVGERLESPGWGAVRCHQPFPPQRTQGPAAPARWSGPTEVKGRKTPDYGTLKLWGDKSPGISFFLCPSSEVAVGAVSVQLLLQHNQIVWRMLKTGTLLWEIWAPTSEGNLSDCVRCVGSQVRHPLGHWNTPAAKGPQSQQCMPGWSDRNFSLTSG